MRSPLKTLLAALDQIPPNVCRLMARKKRGWQALTHLEIAKKSGLPLSTVAEISARSSWRGLKIEVIEAFALACGVDHLRCKREIYYLKRSKLIHLKRGDANQRRMYSKLMQAA